MNASEIKFRASCIGHIMTNPREKTETISKTAKDYLLKVYMKEKYSREYEIKSKFLEKGNLAEELAITLYSRYSKQLWFKNEEQLTNDYISGTPDLIPNNEEIKKASHVVDLKTSWNLETFLEAGHGKLNSDYYWQLQAYMALTGASTATLAYCLVNTPAHLIDDEKRKLMYRMNAGTTENPEYIEKARILERNMIFNLPQFQKDYSIYDLLTDVKTWQYDVPLSESVMTFSIERNEDDISRMYERVIACRKYMDEHLFKAVELVH